MTRRRSRANRLWRWVLRTIVFGALVSAAAVLAFRWVAPPYSSVMIQRLIGGEHVRHEWVPLSRISSSTALAVVAAEDQEFPQHWGFDLDAIGDALEDKVEGGRLRGASTISQQVAKNLFLWEGRSWLRKGLEAWLTLLVEGFWPKSRILEVYLNIAEMGDNVFGVGEASRHHFRRPADSLSAEQAALLAATLPNPRRYSAAAPSSYLRARQRWILRQMDQLGGPAYLAGILPP